MKKLTALILVLFISLSLLISCVNPSDTLFDDTPGYFTYTSFTIEERNIFLTYIGEIIPFIPTDHYTVCEIYEDEGYEGGVRYYTIGNNERDYLSYLDALEDSGFEQQKIITDDSDNDWIHYQKHNVALTISYYYYNGNFFIDVCARYTYSVPDYEGILSNKGMKLPYAEDGVYEIDLTQSEYVKTASELSDNIGGCPSVGLPGVLVIPIEFPDLKASTKDYSIRTINKIFTGKNDFYSVDEYYYLSSYGKLDLDITVLDEWFCAEENSSYYKNLTYDYYGDLVEIGDQVLLNEALDYLDDKMDLSKFDSDGNGTIDAVVMVTTLTPNSDSMFTWAYKYTNFYEDDEGNLYEYDDVHAYDYVWVCYPFMHEKKTISNGYTYTDRSVLNPTVFIHEFAHVLGVEDYYDTSATMAADPLYDADIMDGATGDHNAFTKFSLGWITESRLVTSDKPITLSLKPFSESGDTIIIANNFSEKLGAYQEYYILVYYKNTGLNASNDKYFSDNGIAVYHVNATLNCQQYRDEVFYSLINSNTPKGQEGGSSDNLIELLGAGRNKCVLKEGDRNYSSFDDNGELLRFSYTVVSLSDDEAVITFTPK